MKRILFSLSFAVLLSVQAFAVQPLCPVGGGRQPTAVERQRIEPETLLRCFMTAAEIAIVHRAIGRHAQATVTDPAFESGKLNPDGSRRRPLTALQTSALTKMYSILDDDRRDGAILRKFVQNRDVGGILYGRTVIGLPSSPRVVTTDTVRGFVGLERNTLGLDAGETVGALGLDFETTDEGQYTDAGDFPLHREVAREVYVNGLHSIRHVMSATGAEDAQIPLAKDLHDFVEANAPTLEDRSFESNRQGQTNPYTGLGISHHIGLLVAGTESFRPLQTYPVHLNEEHVMSVPTPLAVGDQLYRRRLNGREIKIADYVAVENPDGSTTNRWVLASNLPASYRRYYERLIEAAEDLVLAHGG